MKKSFVAIVALIFLTACFNDNKNSNAPSNGNAPAGGASPLASPSPPPDLKPEESADLSFKPCNEYFPLTPGSITKYSILYSSGLQADATVVVDRMPSGSQGEFLESTQIVDKTGGTHKLSLTKAAYACDNGRVKILSQSEDNKVDNNSNHVEYQYTQPAIAMIEPSAMRPGTDWSYDLTEVFQLPGQKPIPTNQTITTSFSVGDAEDISVPAGTFKSVKVARKVGTTTIVEYYARGMGMVKRVTQDGTTWSLKEYSGIRPVERPAK